MNLKLWAIGSMMTLSSLFAVKTNAINIPITSFSTTAGTLNGTASCVIGYWANGWTGSVKYFQYQLNTTGYTGTIAMDYSAQRSGTGPQNFQIWYSINNGPEQLVSVANGGQFTITNTSCNARTATLPATCAGVADLKVRIKSVAPFPTNASGTFRVDSINVFDAASAACSATPTGGSTTVTAGTNPTCAGTGVTLSLTGSSAGSGISYQWQSSPNGTTWSNIVGQTGLSLSVAPTSTTHYRVVVTCAGFGSANSTATQVTVNPLPSVAAITGYTAPLLVGDTQNLANATAGGVWSSSDPSVATVDFISGQLIGEFGGTTVVTYSVTNGVTGCIGSSSVNVNCVWENTLALYAGINGNSTATVNVPGDVVSPLSAVGFGANTPCGSGGISGLTMDVADSVFNINNPYVGYTVRPTTGNALNMFRIHARARISGDGPAKAVIAYQSFSNGTPSGWQVEPNPVTLVSGSCGASANSWDFNTGDPANPNPTVTGIKDSLQVRVYPFKPASATGTFQLNTLEVYGIVTTNADCSGASIVTNADSVLPRVVNICDSGSRFLNYNIGFGGVAGVGVSYQWQQSVNGTTWTDITDATGVVYQTPVLVAGVDPDTIYYRVQVNCDITGSSAFSASNIVTVHATPANAGVISGGIAPTAQLPMRHMLIGTTYPMTSTVPGGTWSSNDTSSISFGGTATATPNLPGDAIITYRTLVNGCMGVTRDTFAAYYPNTKALYIGKGGNSTAVYAASGATATALATANWGSATACGSGGISGLTNTNTTQSTSTNGRVSTTVASTGVAFGVTEVRATLRKTNSGTYKAYLGYKPTASSTWTFDPAPVDVETDDCGYSHNELTFAVTGVTVTPGTSYDFAVFGYNGTATVGLQVNTISVRGTGTQLINGTTDLNTIVNNGSDVQLFPNPATNVLNVKASEKVDVAIFSIEGKKLIEQKGATRIDVSSLVSGMYLIQVYGENNTLLKAEKFVKK